jgi:hypothetical protein
MIRDPSLLLRERFENQQPVPAIGAQNRDNDLDTERFRRWWTDIYNHALFECEAQLLQDDYVGQGAMNDAAHRLRELNQEEVLQDGTRITHDTDNHYQRVQAIIDELPIETPYGFSVIEVFHNSLTQSLKDQVKADGITLPPTGNMRNVEQLDELSRYVQHTKNAENKIKNISRIANSSSQGRGTNRGNVFMGNIMTHDDTYQDNTEYGDRPDNSDEFITENPYQCAPHAFMTNNRSNPTEADVMYNLMLNDAEQNLQGVHCFAATGVNRYNSGSTANAALAQASNMPYPLECWGCCNHSDPKKHAERYHPWRNCPHKQDPETNENAKKGLSEYWKNRDNKRRGLAAQWKEIGLPNQECGEHLHAIANPRNSTEDKKRAVAGLMRAMIGTTTREPTPRANEAPQFNFGETPGGAYYPSFIAKTKKPRVFQLTSAMKRFKMPVSETLPHMKIRIGGKDTLFGLDVAVDTCAAMNLAYKAYHTQIYKLYPQLVAEYIDFKQEGYKTFDVGGIDDDEQGLTVDAAITYYTPFFHKGEQVKIQFALSDSLTTNTILGFPSIIRMKLAMVLHKGYIHSEILNEQFPITMKVPTRTSTPPNVTDTETPTLLLANETRDPTE